jgi:hypothetical protein
VDRPTKGQISLGWRTHRFEPGVLLVRTGDNRMRFELKTIRRAEFEQLDASNQSRDNRFW